MAKLSLRIAALLGGVGLVTFWGYQVAHINATTVGFAYLLLVLVIASTWGFVEAAIASLVATLAFNLFFLPPVGTLTIADPQNWVALFSFLATALIAGRLSAKAERRAQEAIARRQDVEHLYTFSRSILLIDGSEPFPKQLTQTLAEAFAMDAVALYDRRTGQIFRGGPGEVEGLDDQLRESARLGASFADADRKRLITSIRLGSEPIAALALQGAEMPDSVLQGIANLVAIGLERARAQDLAHQIEAARRSEQLRTTLLDAMAHEFKTPLTSIKAATTALLADPGQPLETRTELLAIADEEAEHLRLLIDDSIEMARLDTDQIDLNREPVSAAEIVRDAVASMKPLIEDREVIVACEDPLPSLYLDRRLIRLAIRQVLDNALKYSPPSTPVRVRVTATHDLMVIDVTDQGKGVPPEERDRIFERFYRGQATGEQIPGSGLGLSIAQRVVYAHGGELSVTSRPGETTFRMALPVELKGEWS